MGKLALTFYSVLRMPIADILQCARVAEEAGFGFISVAESFYRDGAALAAAIACNTRTIRLGTSVFPIYTRTPFQLAMAMATLDELSSGRMGYLGLGVGYRNRTEDYFGIKIERPLERMREYVDIIRRLLAGDETGYQGEFFRFKTFSKFAGLSLHIPIYFGSSGAKMLSLAGEVADGVILNSLVTPAHIQQAKALMQQGAARAGRDPSRLSIAASVIYAEVGKASRWREFRQGMWEVVSNRAIVIASSVEAAMYLGVGALMGFLPLYAKNIAQLSDASVGVLIWVPLVMAMVGKPLAGRISDRLGRKPVILAGLMLCIAMLPLIPLTTQIIGLVIAGALFGLGMAIVTPSTTALVTDLCKAGNYGAALGVFGTIWDVGEASGSILAGALIFAVGSLESPGAYLLAFSIVAVVMVAVGLLFGLTVRGPEVTTQRA